MPAAEATAKSIFWNARELASPADREAYLAEACGGDAELRSRVERLLAAEQRSDSFLDPPLATPSDDSAPAEEIGTEIGPYKLLERIGEGGMGVVYMAAQKHPVERTVALKIIKPGMDTRACIARFEAERQALALMNHPNIAQVLDAGTVGPDRRPGPDEQPDAEAPEANSRTSNEREQTPNPQSQIPNSPGRPYFVMELVRGLPITDYCDEHRLGIRERLELFVSVCRAVQHAHQKGVIHRDLKPTNVLVELHDVVPVPKVIDFGVAKAISRPLTERTLHTGFHQMIGTPMYMSPEQAELSGLDVDTRSDVYSLGVLLYELLTGATPFDRDALQRVGYDEMRRMIREDDPPRPSGRLSTLAAASLSTIAARRAIDPRKLTTALHGDVDWIVMKCLEKDRTRRYETAADLARDIESHLADEPVAARPPSRAYRAKKFVRKHRAGVLTTAAVMFALTVGIIATSLALARAIAERHLAQENLICGCELIEKALEPTYQDLAAAADPERLQQRNRITDQTVRFFESLGAQAKNEPRVRFGMAKAYAHLAYFELLDGKDGFAPAKRAVALLEPLVAQHPRNRAYVDRLGDLYGDMGRAYWFLGQRKRFAAECGKGVALLRTAVSEGYAFDRFVLIAGLYGDSLRECGRFREAEEQFSAALEVAQYLHRSSSSELKPIEKFHELTAHVRYADLLIDTGRYADAEAHLDTAIRLGEDLVASQSTASQRLLNKFWWAIAESALGELKIIHREPDAALQYLQRASELLEGSSGRANYIQGFTHYRRGLALTQLGQLEEAISAYEQAERCWRSLGTRLALDHAARSKARTGELYYALGRPEQGDEHLAAALSELKASVYALPDEPTVDPLVAFLCTCPNPALRDPEQAVRLAERFKSDCESSGPFWRYLGLARYRAGDWQGAEEAIHKSIQLRNGRDALDRLLLAASQHQSARHDQAEASFRHAQDLIRRAAPIYYGHIGVLGHQRLLAEVEQLLH